MSSHDRPRIIAGFGRSGTTWLLDALAEANSLRPVFEPLHPDHIAEAIPYAHRYLTETDTELPLQRLLHRFFHESYMSLWVDYRILTHRLHPKITHLQSIKAPLTYLYGIRSDIKRFHAQRKLPWRIVKLIRANMMLAWLHATFDARIVFIIRHPAAVVSSQMSAPKAWNPLPRLERYRRDARLVEVLDHEIRSMLEGNLSPIEAFTLSWCIENKIALSQAAACNIPVFYYERLLENGASEWRDIASALELGEIPDAGLIARPSQQAWGDKANDATLVRRYGSWMDRIDSSTARTIQNTLDRTGITIYNVNEPLPLGRRRE